MLCQFLLNSKMNHLSAYPLILLGLFKQIPQLVSIPSIALYSGYCQSYQSKQQILLCQRALLVPFCLQDKDQSLSIGCIEALHSLGPVPVSNLAPCHFCFVAYLQHCYSLNQLGLIMTPYHYIYMLSLFSAWQVSTHSLRCCSSDTSFIEMSFPLFPSRVNVLSSICLVP